MRMGGEEGYVVPAIDWKRTSRRVMTLDWVEGIKLTDRDALAAAGHDRADIVQLHLQRGVALAGLQRRMGGAGHGGIEDRGGPAEMPEVVGDGSTDHPAADHDDAGTRGQG